MIARETLESALGQAPRLSIGLVGDLFLDRYLEIDPELFELSVETELEAYQVTKVRYSPGALGTVMNNLAALWIKRLVPVTVIGDDGEGHDLLKTFDRLPVDRQHILQVDERVTPTYTKPMKQGPDGIWRELNRLDLRNRRPLSGAVEDRLLVHLAAAFAETDGLIVCDQVAEEGWGVIGPRVREFLHELALSDPEKLILVDSRAHIGKFRSGVLKPNRRECLLATGRKPDDELAASAAAMELARQTSQPVFCTLGDEGMLVARPHFPKTIKVPTYESVGTIDPVGAGDSASAGIAIALLAGTGDVEAASVGNLVASITIQQLGTTGVASPAQVVARWQDLFGRVKAETPQSLIG